MSKVFRYDPDLSIEYEYGVDYDGDIYDDEELIVYEYDVEPEWDCWATWGKRNNDWEVEWTGWYKQNGFKHDMIFTNFQCDSAGNIWGHGVDDVGSFNIAGRVKWDNTGFKFSKQYYGAHTVVYKGNIQNGSTWAGKWHFDGDGGNFQLRCNVQKWKGAFWQNGQKNKMVLDMKVDNYGVYGNGHDKVGGFIIRGDVSGKNVSFYKQYFGAHTVLYHGQMNGARTDIRGGWQIPGNCKGKFHLHL